MSGSIRLYGSTSGFVELQAPAVAADNTVNIGDIPQFSAVPQVGDTIVYNGTDWDTQPVTTALDFYPVGSIYMSVVNTNPSVLFGGTWVEFGSGRVVVGVDTGDADFNTVEKTGGAKTHTHTTPVHSHTTPAHSHASASHIHNLPWGWDSSNTFYGLNSSNLPLYGSDVPTDRRAVVASPPWGGATPGDGGWRRARSQSTTPGNTGNASPTTNVADVNTDASSSVQPYITAYMFKRTA